MNITVSPKVLEYHKAHKARRARMAANAWKPKLIEAPKPEIKPEIEEKHNKTRVVFVEHDWVKKWKAREAEDMKNAVPLSAPTVQEIQYFCLRQEWEIDGLTIFANDVSFNELISPRRMRRIAYMRFIAIYIASKLTSKSNVEIGKYFGKMDHTSILHAKKRMDNIMRENKILMNGKPFNLDRIGGI